MIVICHENDKEEIAKCHLNGTWQPNPSDINLCDSNKESQSHPGKPAYAQNNNFDMIV